MRKLLLGIFLFAEFFNQTMAQDATIYTENGTAIPVRNTGNNTLVELYK